MNIVSRDECDDCGVATSCEPALLLYLTTPRFQERDNCKHQSVSTGKTRMCTRLFLACCANDKQPKDDHGCLEVGAQAMWTRSSLGGIEGTPRSTLDKWACEDTSIVSGSSSRWAPVLPSSSQRLDAQRGGSRGSTEIRPILPVASKLLARLPLRDTGEPLRFVNWEVPLRCHRRNYQAYRMQHDS